MSTKLWGNWKEVQEDMMTREELEESLRAEMEARLKEATQKLRDELVPKIEEETYNKLLPELRLKAKAEAKTHFDKNVAPVFEKEAEAKARVALRNEVFEDVKRQYKESMMALPMVERDYKHQTYILLKDGREYVIKHNNSHKFDQCITYYADDEKTDIIASFYLSQIQIRGDYTRMCLVEKLPATKAPRAKKNEQT